MLRIIAVISVFLVMANPLSAEEKIEKSVAALNVASEIIIKYADELNPDVLKKASSIIEKSWAEFGKYYPEDHILMARFSLLRARSLYAAGRLQKAVAAWQFALQHQGFVEPNLRIQLLTEAAAVSGKAGAYKKASEYFAASRVLVGVNNKSADHARLYLRMKELQVTGKGLEWRRLRDALLDVRKFSEKFVTWSGPRMDALLNEAELRFSYQPNLPEKRDDLAALKIQIELAHKGLGENIQPAQLERMRSLFYALEDYFRL